MQGSMHWRAIQSNLDGGRIKPVAGLHRREEISPTIRIGAGTFCV
jgi:hypothetical protein